MFFCLFFYIISAKKGLNPQLQDGTLSGDDDGADGNDDDGTWPGPVRCLLGFRNCPTPMCRNTGKDYVIFRKDVNTCMTPS